MKAIPVTLQPDIECNWEYAPGALVTASNMVPMRRGSYATWSCHVTSNSLAEYARTTYPIAAGIVRLPDNTVRAFAFEKQAIYELNSNLTTATDRSKGGGYNASTAYWTWTMFGSLCIAVNKLDAPQSSSSGAFADLSGSPPKARCVVSQLGFVMMLNYNDGTDTPDGWWCSQLENPTGSWTPSLSTQAANGRLYDTPGPITAAVALRDSVVAFKQDSIFIGDYIGDTTNGIIWGWRLISDRVGCLSPHGVALLNDKLYFIHRTNIYEFDGAAVRPIGDPIATTYLGAIAGGSATGFSSVQTVVDQTEGIVFWFFDASTSSKLNSYIAYNTASGKFGIGTVLADDDTGTTLTDYYATAACKTTQSDLVTFLGASSGDYTTATLMGKKSATKTGLWNGRYPGNDSTNYGQITGTIRTGPIGDGQMGNRMVKVRPRFRKYDTNNQNSEPTGTFFGSKNEADLFAGSATLVTPTWNTTEYCLDGLMQNRYMQAQIVFDGAVELSGLAVEMIPSATK